MSTSPTQVDGFDAACGWIQPINTSILTNTRTTYTGIKHIFNFYDHINPGNELDEQLSFWMFSCLNKYRRTYARELQGRCEITDISQRASTQIPEGRDGLTELHLTLISRLHRLHLWLTETPEEEWYNNSRLAQCTTSVWINPVHCIARPNSVSVKQIKRSIDSLSFDICQHLKTPSQSAILTSTSTKLWTLCPRTNRDIIKIDRGITLLRASHNNCCKHLELHH